MSDRDAEFLEFVAANRGRMVRTARLLAVGDAHAAEDLVQTALTRLYVHWSKAGVADDPSRYADRTLLNVFIDERKRLWRHRETRGSTRRVTSPAMTTSASSSPG